MPGSGVAAGPLAHLEADPTGGAAGRPGGPGGPASVPGERKQRSHKVRLTRSLHAATSSDLPVSHVPHARTTGLWAGKGRGTGATGQDWTCYAMGPGLQGDPAPGCLILEFRLDLGQ